MTKELNFFESTIETTTEEEAIATLIAEEEPETQREEKESPSPLSMEQELFFHTHIKKVIEALLFASQEPLSLSKIKEVTDTVLPLKPKTLAQIIHDLQLFYLKEQRSFRLEEIADGYLLRSSPEYSSYIEMLYKNKKADKLSHASLEVLAIVAYKQPITKPEIDSLRGVDSSGTLYNLLERELIEPVGKQESLGRPTLYGVTKHFLTYFGLRSLSDLPQV